jgi:glycerol kinase
MAEACVLAIDQGTTGTTALVVDGDSRVRARATAEIGQHYPRPGWVEHDPEEIWRVTLAVTGAALAGAGPAAGALAAVGITNQRETVVLWDRATGQPVAPAIVWQDRRTAAHCDALRDRGLEGAVRAATGLVIDPYFSATKIRWLLDHVPGLRRRAETGEIAFGTIDCWLLWKLTGGRVHATDVSNASRTLLFDIRALAWDPQLLALFDVPEAILPEVRPSSGPFGHTDPAAFPVARPVPIAGVAGDQQAALFGQAGFVAGRAKNTYGTGSFLLMNTGTEAVASRERLLTSVAWRLGREPPVYALEGAIFITGAAVQWLRDGLGLIDEAAETDALAASLTGNDGVYFVPALTGLGAPHWDAYARGTLLGVTRGTGRAHLARAVLESIAYQTRDVVDAMRRDCGIVLDELRCDGGGTANDFLMQFQADILGVPVVVPEVAETTALGAAYLAGLGAGVWEAPSAIEGHWCPARRYAPRMDEAERARLHRRWLEAVARARGWARDEPA